MKVQKLELSNVLIIPLGLVLGFGCISIALKFAQTNPVIASLAGRVEGVACWNQIDRTKKLPWL